MRNRLLVFVTLATWLLSSVAAQAQSVWPPLQLDARATTAGDQVTFEIKVTNVADFTLADLTLKSAVPSGSTYVGGHPDFDGGIVSFDGQDASFFVIGLPARATVGFRYTVHLDVDPSEAYPIEIWAGWKGRLPGQALFNPVAYVSDGAQSSPSGDSVDRANANGLDIIQVFGSPYEQGLERGRLLAAKIQTQVALHLAAVLPQSFGGSRDRWLEEILPLSQQLDVDVLAELQGMADGSQTPLDDLMLLNFSPYVASADSTGASTVACSVVATVNAANEKGGLLLGRQQDQLTDSVSPVFIVRSYADRRPNRVDVTQPASLEIFASLTASGLFFEGHPAFTREAVPPGAVDLYSVIARTLRSARTLDEMEKRFTEQPRLKAMNVTIADLTTGDVRCLELGFDRHATNKPDADGVLISTNHFAAKDLEDLRPPTVNRSLTRYERLRAMVNQRLGHITAPDLETFLHDPEVTAGSGVTLVLDPETGSIRYWDQWRGQWFALSLSDLLGSSTLPD